jgi:hypothetical protein
MVGLCSSSVLFRYYLPLLPSAIYEKWLSSYSTAYISKLEEKPNFFK